MTTKLKELKKTSKEADYSAPRGRQINQENIKNQKNLSEPPRELDRSNISSRQQINEVEK